MTEGNNFLVNELKRLTQHAERGEFDDLASEHATPKMLLYGEFQRLAEKVRSGDFD